ncbi:MAG: diacylglycerol kinase family lipid kinase [Lachnospiraceae bacterium]|nr:diacylglycerol kinase family lipid kinase [Lachnospiraceae bacterium]
MGAFKRIYMVINPNAGVRKKGNVLNDIVNIFSDHGFETVVSYTRKSGDAATLVEEHVDDQIDLIVCMGGDGTLNETLSGARKIGWKKPVGYIPAGSTNDFASSLGLSSDPEEAAKRIMEGKPKRLDLGVFNGRTFVYTASCGLFTRTSYETPQKFKNRLGHLAYILEGMKDLTQFTPNYMKIDTGEEVYEGEFILTAVCNTFSLGGVMSLDNGEIDLGDGLFEILMIRQPKDIAQMNETIKALYEQNFDHDQVNLVKVRKAKIICPEREDWSLDGERGEGLEVNEFEVVSGGMKLIY